MKAVRCGAAGRWVMVVALVAVMATAVVCGVGGGAAQAAPSFLSEIVSNSVGLNNGGVAVHAGRVAWIAARDDPAGNAMFVYDSLTEAVRVVSTHVGAPDHHDYHAMAGDLLVWVDFSAKPYKIWGVDLATGEERLITTLTSEFAGIATDGQYIAWNDSSTPGGQTDIHLYNWANGAAAKLSTDPAHDYGAVVDGGYVAWMRENPSLGGPASVLLYTIGTGQTEVLTDDAVAYTWVNLDQGRAVWESGPSSNPDIVMLDLTSRTAVTVGAAESPGRKIFVAFRGNTIAWATGDDADQEVWVYSIKTDEVTRVTNDLLSDEWIDTDGRWVAWLKYDGQSAAVFAYDTVTRQTIQLSEFVAISSDPRIDRGRLVFSTGPGSGTQVYSVTLPLFDDVLVGAPYFSAIQGLAERRLIGGYPQTDGTTQFRPANSVLRAQYAKMIDGALGLSVLEDMTPPVNFNDLGADDLTNLYPHEFVWTAYVNQIVKGYDDGSFKPYTEIKRGHVVTMTVRAVQRLHPLALLPVPPAFPQTWGLDLLPEHKANARIAQYNDLLLDLPLDGVAADGTAPMPRQEVAQVMWNMMRVIAPAFWWVD